MGYINHHAIIVTSYDEALIKEAHEEAVRLCHKLVSPILSSVVNKYFSFLVAPDGSKEGWGDSNQFDEKRAEIVEFINAQDGAVNYVEVSYSPDNGTANVTSHNL